MFGDSNFKSQVFYRPNVDVSRNLKSHLFLPYPIVLTDTRHIIIQVHSWSIICPSACSSSLQDFSTRRPSLPNIPYPTSFSLSAYSAANGKRSLRILVMRGVQSRQTRSTSCKSFGEAIVVKEVKLYTTVTKHTAFSVPKLPPAHHFPSLFRLPRLPH